LFKPLEGGRQKVYDDHRRAARVAGPAPRMNMTSLRPVAYAACVGAMLLAGCASGGGEVTVTKSPGVETIPKTVGIYPLLSTETTVPHPRPIPFSTKADREGVYITPPTDSKLTLTLQSQMVTDLLGAELSYRGFALKEVPVETPEERGDKHENTFYVSLALLEQLREDYGLQALLLGNVYFVPNRYDPAEFLVRAAYLRMIDVATLDVLCHVSINNGTYGATMEETARQLGLELGAMAASDVPARQPEAPDAE
jgi:hypothetical protein